MDERVELISGQFEQARDEFLELVSALSDEQWSAPLGDDPRSAGVIAHHVASGYEATTDILLGLMGGADIEITWDYIHNGNAEHAETHDGVGREETIALLRANGNKTEATLKSLSDAELDQLVNFPLFGSEPIPAQAVIEGLIIGHIGMHAPDFSPKS